MKNGGTLQTTTGGGMDEREEAGREGKGDLISTLLGLREQMWSRKERMNDCEEEPCRYLEGDFKQLVLYYCSNQTLDKLISTERGTKQ